MTVEELVGIRFEPPGVTFVAHGVGYSWWALKPYESHTCERGSDALEALTDYYLRTRAQTNAA